MVTLIFSQPKISLLVLWWLKN